MTATIFNHTISLDGMRVDLATSVAADGVSVNAIAPALMTRPEWCPAIPPISPRGFPSAASAARRRPPISPSRSSENAYLTDQVISIDGGMHPR
jgi:3-oxoacyl-[acyl-carrier protein] reductase